MEDEESVAPGLSQEDEESRSDEDDRDSEAQELSRGPASPPRAEGDCASDLRDEASSVTRDLDEHELDYDEEVPEEPAPGAQEDDAEKAGPEDDEERGEGAPGEEGKVGVRTVEDKEPPEAAKEKRKEDDDGEIDDGEIDVSRRGGRPEEGSGGWRWGPCPGGEALKARRRAWPGVGSWQKFHRPSLICLVLFVGSY